MAIAKGSKSKVVVAEEAVFGIIPTGVKASKTLTQSGQPSDAETVTVGGKTYRFKNAIAAINDVLIDSTAALTLTNLYNAINAGAGAGTKYFTGTTANANVTATNPTATTLIATAILYGTSGNSIAIAETATNYVWAGGAVFLSGGTSYKTRTIGFVSETLDENINKVTSGEIRGNRQVPNIRGGNITTGGGFSNDFCIPKSLVFLKHLLAATVTPVAYDVPVLANGSLTRGQYFYTTANNVYLVVLGGTYTGGASGPDDAGGAAGALTTTGGCTFQFISTFATGVSQYVLVGGTDFSTGGLDIEKQLKGGSTDMYVAFRGCRIDSLDLTISQENITQAAWGFVGLNSVANSVSNFNEAAVAQTVTGEALTGFQAFVGFGTGQTGRPVREGSLRITNNIDASVFVLGSRYRREVPEGQRDVTGRLTVYFEDRTEYDDFKNETVVDLELSFANHGEFLLISLPETKITGSGTPKISGQGIVTADYEISAFNDTGANDITATAYCSGASGLTLQNIA